MELFYGVERNSLPERIKMVAVIDGAKIKQEITIHQYQMDSCIHCRYLVHRPTKY